jgi:hypothetical protein
MNVVMLERLPMRLDLPMIAAGFATCLSLAAPACAAINVYDHAGAWDAFDGQAKDGKPLCGVGSENPADGRSFSISKEIGATDTTVLARRPTWKIPPGTRMPVVVQLGLQRPWVAQATGRGNTVEWTMDAAAAGAFDAQFRNAPSMTVTFPSGNEKPWIIELNGSTAVSNAMRRCVVDLARQAPAPLPPAASAAPAQPPTQPFGAGPTISGGDATTGQTGTAAPAGPPASPAINPSSTGH